MSYWKWSLVCAAICGAAAPSGAVVVTSIKISNAIPDYLQVAEVVATQAGTGADVALASAGATAYGTSVYNSSYGADLAIDGIDSSSAGFFHSHGDDGTDYLLITFAQAYDLSALTIYGRADAYSTRDYYSYQLLNGTDVVGFGNIDARNGTNSGGVSLATDSAVPEPATWAMMIGGFGMVGGASRRKKIAVSFA